MSETAPAPVAAPPADSGTKNKKKTQTKKAASAKKSPKACGPSVSELIVQAVSASKERRGVSLSAVKKSLAAAGFDVENNNSRINKAVKGLVIKETLVQVKGSGASGSFKLNKKPSESKVKAAKPKKAPAKVKKPAPKKVTVKSPAKAKKPAAKSPKKAKKPAAAKKAAKSPKKVKVAKPKKIAKSPAKKAVKPKAAKSPAKGRKAAPKKK